MSEALTSRYTGIFTQQGRVPLRPHDPDIACWAGTLPGWGGGDTDLAVGGAGWTAEHARLAGLGEAIERWQCRLHPRDRTVTSSYEAWPMSERAVAPDAWVLFHDEQYEMPDFPFVKLNPRAECRWVCCREVVTGKPTWVPTEFVFLEGDTHSHAFAPAISTGLSAGRIGDSIVLRGLQEVIERDALVGAWWGNYPLEELPFDRALEALTPERARAILRPNLRYRLFRIASPYSECITLVTLEGEEEVGYCFSVGSACRETLAASVEKAILEAVQGRHLVRHLRERGYDHLFQGGVPVDFQGHALFYSLHPELLDETIFHKVNTAEWAPRYDKETTAELVRRLAPRPVLVRNVTPPTLQNIGTEWTVCRVVVPGLQPLHGHHAFPFLGGPLWQPRKVEAWRTTLPHPYA